VTIISSSKRRKGKGTTTKKKKTDDVIIETTIGLKPVPPQSSIETKAVTFAEKITQDILKFVPSTATITDATACIGGSAHSFAQTFAKVFAIEIDPTRFNYLQNNVNVLSDANIVCIHGDALKECVRIKQDVIFIDPPWGGPEYKNRARVSLYLSNIPLHDVCKTLSKHTQYIVIKVPTNFDDVAFYAATSASLQLVHKNTSLRKMNLIILKAIA
jgi:predicted RNA methylase